MYQQIWQILYQQMITMTNIISTNVDSDDQQFWW